MSNDIAIIFGAGAKIGVHVTKKLLGNNYKVVTVSRADSLDIGAEANSHYHYKGDLSDLELVGNVFKKTRELYGEPRVIIYNAAAVKITDGGEDSFSFSTEEFLNHQAINVTSTLLSIKESINSFKSVKSSKPKTFIFTGNAQNLKPFPVIASLGIGKSGTYSSLTVADEVFGKKYGFRYYYADQRTAEGEPVIPDGKAEAEFYFDLAENENKLIPVEATFVKGQGYVKF